jgi:hypothetical protein
VIGPLPSTSVRGHVAVLGWALVVRLVLVCLVFRECLDHVVMLNETHLRRLLSAYLIYYHGARTHLSLAKDAPEPRWVERLDEGRIVETPMAGGLHHRYGRRAA